MRTAHVDRVVRDLDVDELVDLVHPSLVRDETWEHVERGLSQAVRHVLHVNAVGSGWLRVDAETEFNPLGLRGADGRRLGLLTRYVPGHWDRHVDPGLILGGDEPVLFMQRPDPAWSARPSFPQSASIRVPNPRHLLAHPQRWLGYSMPQVRARMHRVVREMTHEVRAEELGGYYYLDPANRARSGWCWVAPLRLGRRDPAIPAVLRPVADGLDLVTVLGRHEAFWNVAATGQVPPLWLRASGDSLDEAA